MNRVHKLLSSSPPSQAIARELTNSQELVRNILANHERVVAENAELHQKIDTLECELERLNRLFDELDAIFNRD